MKSINAYRVGGQEKLNEAKKLTESWAKKSPQVVMVQAIIIGLLALAVVVHLVVPVAMQLVDWIMLTAGLGIRMIALVVALIVGYLAYHTVMYSLEVRKKPSENTAPAASPAPLKPS